MSSWMVLPGGRVKRFQNRRTRCCCAKRRKGRPRVGYGLCHGRCEAASRVLRRTFRTEMGGLERDREQWEMVCRKPPRVRDE